MFAWITMKQQLNTLLRIWWPIKCPASYMEMDQAKVFWITMVHIWLAHSNITNANYVVKINWNFRRLVAYLLWSTYSKSTKAVCLDGNVLNALEIYPTQESENLPKVTIAISIVKPTPFIEEFFDSILALDYPQNKISIFIFNSVGFLNKFHIEMSIVSHRVLRHC